MPWPSGPMMSAGAPHWSAPSRTCCRSWWRGARPSRASTSTRAGSRSTRSRTTSGHGRRSSPDRPRAGQGPGIVGRYFRKAAGIRHRRSRPSARGGGEPDRQCRKIHRTGRRCADGIAAAREAPIAQDERRLAERVGLREAASGVLVGLPREVADAVVEAHPGGHRDQRARPEGRGRCRLLTECRCREDSAASSRRACSGS